MGNWNEWKFGRCNLWGAFGCPDCDAVPGSVGTGRFDVGRMLLSSSLSCAGIESSSSWGDWKERFMIGARIGRQDCLPWVEERARSEKGDPFTVTLFQDVEGRSKAHCRNFKKENYKKKKREKICL